MNNTMKHQEEWDFDMCNVDNIIGSFRVDLSLAKVAPVAGKPNLVWVGVEMQNAREDGLSSDAESQTLYAIEDELVARFLSNHNAVLAGILTSNFERVFYFYLADATDFYQKFVLPSFAKFPDYKFYSDTKEDKDWEHYFDFLYPSPDIHQRMMNRRVIRNLQNAGDNLNKERMVDHFLYFKNEQDMNAYILEIEKQNFQILKKGFNEDRNEFTLNIGRVDKVDYESVDDYVLYLCKLAGNHNGSYDGWGCTIEKD
ncbi:hypothetical protein FACS189429_8560 [Bacteroidia bacterium]|nr:hypothetical protein FACS189429_8560 [Bacteroidia bacterium]